MLRKRAGLRQEAVAPRLQIHRTTYTKYETDKTTPDQDGLRRLAELFDVSVDYLIGREDEPADRPEQAVLRTGETQLQLSEQELQLLEAFRRMSEEQREQLLRQACTQRCP
jgi:transcriptional regulator with XRE-family HTH domain